MKKTLQHTTRMGNKLSRIPFQLHHKSRNILLQRTILSDGYATDTIFILSQFLKGKIQYYHS